MTRSVLLVVLILTALVLPGMVVTGSAGPDGVAPMVDKPSGDGEYNVGFVFDDVPTTTKTYTVRVKIYYPAETGGEDTQGNLSDAPYPTIVWLPGFGGDESHYSDWINRWVTWGMVVMAVAVNWTDWPNSANITDMEDYLDYLETQNVTPGSRLNQMIDVENFGLSGHSSGGGLSLVNGAFVSRIHAVHTFAAAIGASAVDSIAEYWSMKPLCLQVGKDDATYIEGSRRAYDKIGAINSLIEVIGSGHGGPYEHHVFISFMLLHLDGQTDYDVFLYGEEAVNDYLRNDYDLWFNYSELLFFPPRVTGEVSVQSTPMDQEVTFTGEIEGYYLPTHPQSEFAWDFEDDGFNDFTDPAMKTAVHSYTDPGNMDAVFKYKLGRLNVVLDTPLTVTVINVDPIAMAGGDMSADEDQVLAFDASASTDTASDNDTLQFMWDFDDGGKTAYSTDPTASHTFADEGDYEVELTVKDRHGALSTDWLNVTVTNVAPTADPGFDVHANEDEEVGFSGAGNDTASDLADLMYKWAFGDGEVTDWDNDPTAKHTYVKKGNYTVTLSVKDDDDAVATDDLKVMVNNVPPTGGITLPEDGAEFEEDVQVDFFGWGEDTVSDKDGLEFMWDFGDLGSTQWDTDATTSHSYTRSGEYNVTFHVRDDDGDTVTHVIKVVIDNLAPQAEILEPVIDITVDEDTKVSFEGKGEDTASDAKDLGYLWEIEGTTYTSVSVDHTFTKAGIYEVWFKVTDPDGETARVSMEVRVRNVVPQLSASVQPLQVDLGGPINFSASATDTVSDIEGLEYLWDFNDGTTSSNSTGQHVFSSAGTYKVGVTVMDDDGASATLSFTVTVKDDKKVTPPPDDDDGGGLDMMLVGGMIGLIVAIIVIVLVLMLLRSKKKDKDTFFAPEGETYQERGPPRDEETTTPPPADDVEGDTDGDEDGIGHDEAGPEPPEPGPPSDEPGDAGPDIDEKDEGKV